MHQIAYHYISVQWALRGFYLVPAVCGGLDNPYADGFVETVVWLIVLFVVQLLLADYYTERLKKWNGGFGLAKRGSDELQAMCSDGRIYIVKIYRSEKQILHFDLNRPHSFLLRKHQLADKEARADQDATRYLDERVPFIYRDSFEVVIDADGKQTVLAEVLSEDHGRYQVRSLQEMVSKALGNVSAGITTRQAGQDGLFPVKSSPPLD